MVAAFLASSLLALGRLCVGHRGCRSVGKPTWNGFCGFLHVFDSISFIHQHSTFATSGKKTASA